MLLKKSSLLLALAFLVSVCPGCSSSGVRLRPDGTPERQFCPDGALEAMKDLGITQGDLFSILIDRRQRDRGAVVIADGAIESTTTEDYTRLPYGTRLYGQAWTAAPVTVIRYHEALLPDGTRLPFCAVAEEEGHGLVKHANSPRGVAILDDNRAGLRIVGAYN
ncbi:serine/threonine protein kinase [Archangium sp.]|uniref:serine/threonine protein kinase n=1 Tax=Archangium sp. TaxID=1872627 RepID=UPI002D6DF0F6|nr:serine/threonine protein kinase [Archangium sp.]HYO58612.1 serine/threonine protein kinase [Archangium sp.]